MSKRLTALLLCAVLLLSVCVVQSPAQAAGEKKAHGTVIVSLGDSYSSGEGIEPFYGQDVPMAERVHDQDWYDKTVIDTCVFAQDWYSHRSMNAWSGMLTLPAVDGVMSEHRNSNWYFAACSGARTENINFSKEPDAKQKWDYNRDGQKGTVYIRGQLDILERRVNFDPKDVDYVTVTIGGNDLGFVDVLKTAALNLGVWPGLYNQLIGRLNHYYDEDGINRKLYDCYWRIHKAAPNATIIVAGYPKLLDPGGCLVFSPMEVSALNSAVSTVNKRIEALVNSLKPYMSIEFVSVEEAFEGHGAYADDPYINPIMFPARDQDLDTGNALSAYSMHPNLKGAQAYAACVQAKINELESAERNVSLVLDVSDSMSGERITQTKLASKKFVETVIPEDCSVGVVTYAEDAERTCDFSLNVDFLQKTVDGVSTRSATNIESGLVEAEHQLTNMGGKRYIVLMTDGEANRGKTGDDLIAYANELKEQGISIYTLGFFQGGGGNGDAQRILEGIASDGHHYEVESVDDLEPFFNDMAEEINGTKFVYVRMECPIDVTVTYNGETLSSAEDSYNTRTSFGTLTFEENPETGERTKILRLREDVANFDIRITGTGEGTMDYTIGYVDDNGDYTDMRTISEVPISESTVIDTGVNRLVKTDLAVDNDGDGEVDKHYTATGPNVVDLTEESRERGFPVIPVAVGGGALVLLTLLIILLIRSRKRDRAELRFCGDCGAPIPRGKDVCPKCGKRAQ